MRLEQENDDLAHELVTSKIALRNDLDQVSLSVPVQKWHHNSFFRGEGCGASSVLLSWFIGFGFGFV